MKSQQQRPAVAMNPLLPIDRYVPDGEPHVFGDRVYLFGSQDREGGDTYCQLDYEFFSAPVDDLSSWSSRGVNYRAVQDPHYSEDAPHLYAPDVVKGNDGRFYLYYCLGGKKPAPGWRGDIGVAVANEPDGVYEFLGHVRNSDGSLLRGYVRFDPAVINDDGVIRLYYGAALPLDDAAAPLQPIVRALQRRLFRLSRAELHALGGTAQGLVGTELDSDMLTVRRPPRRVIPPRVKGTSFEGHAFFEGASIRRIDDLYYLIYSSANSHELCYATSRHPDRDFTYGGVIISNGDIGFEGRGPAQRTNRTGNNHGGIEKIGDQWYVFYHRPTHARGVSRQACAEPIEILPNGAIPQVRVTSSGLHAAGLPSAGVYPAIIASSIRGAKLPRLSFSSHGMPYVAHDAHDRFISGLTNSSTLEYRSIHFDGPTAFALDYRSPSTVHVSVLADGVAIGAISLMPSSAWYTSEPLYIELHGDYTITLKFSSKSTVELRSLAFHPPEPAIPHHRPGV
ncbi:family 43 glycosylhydrolase [Pseudarthrobacter sp. NPDC058119]|uniref:family 43 glycosylhydrolase n=1 Tax=Pseudarthrobacter sp. NPDC058119 TaxID=3346348 RepID=UPI0036DF3421